MPVVRCPKLNQLNPELVVDASRDVPTDRSVLEAHGWPAIFKLGIPEAMSSLDGPRCGSMVAFQGTKGDEVEEDEGRWSIDGHDNEGAVGEKEGGKEE